MLDAASNRQDTTNALIADDAGKRRSNRKCALNNVEVVHVDRRILDTNQHLAGGRSRWLRQVDKLEHLRWFAKGLDHGCAHGRFLVRSAVAEIDEVAPSEWTSGLLQPATRDKAAEVDGLKSEALNQPLDEFLRFRA